MKSSRSIWLAFETSEFQFHDWIKLDTFIRLDETMNHCKTLEEKQHVLQKVHGFWNSDYLIFFSFTTRLREKRQTNYYVSWFNEWFFMVKLIQWFYLLWLKPIFTNFPFVVEFWFLTFSESAQELIFADCNLLYLFFPKVKSCSSWERRQQHIMHAVLAEAERMLFSLIICFGLIRAYLIYHH